ncbi:hypothetical protein FOZ63_008633 [Perkinsus olseni]|uniref:N-alpha-acetyltransferase 60 n=1 Tax=Perkinsus olseni TaxID=32597 RepID=A0A7J6SFB6_PEROL|nr:hypothetical protein FOZ63_008633 [Perkinsus olseni]
MMPLFTVLRLPGESVIVSSDLYFISLEELRVNGETATLQQLIRSETVKRGRVVYIMQVQVRKDWRNKKVGSMMLPKALEHIHWNWPSAVGVHLTVKRANKYAIKLYEKSNFTHVGGCRGISGVYSRLSATSMCQVALSDEEMRSILVYLLRVKVREDWQNKKVGSTMLPGALEDIRRTWPSAVGVHLLVVDDNHFAIKLYEKLNFTDVGGENGSALL